MSFRAGGSKSTTGSAVFDQADGITHRIIISTAANPIKWLDAPIAHRPNNSIATLGISWSFDLPVTAYGQVRHAPAGGLGRRFACDNALAETTIGQYETVCIRDGSLVERLLCELRRARIHAHCTRIRQRWQVAPHCNPVVPGGLAMPAIGWRRNGSQRSSHC